MPPLPPPGMTGASFFFGASATMASVVIIKTSDRRGVLESDPYDLRRIDDAGTQHVDILLGLRVEAVGLGLVLGNLADHHRALDSGVLDDLADRLLKRQSRRSRPLEPTHALGSRDQIALAKGSAAAIASKAADVIEVRIIARGHLSERPSRPQPVRRDHRRAETGGRSSPPSS
jgi:hypothetical protein